MVAAARVRACNDASVSPAGAFVLYWRIADELETAPRRRCGTLVVEARALRCPIGRR
jgi:hypothetical protein